jgi:NAD(P)-dependent dehydrogenase (short-subunit alcohol dehydrogenase family)
MRILLSHAVFGRRYALHAMPCHAVPRTKWSALLLCPAVLLQGYGAAKAGLLGLTHAQAASLAGLGIRVNAVLPGWIDTSDPAENGGNSVLRPEDHAWHWSGRVGVPADVAEMVAFLADDSKAGFITGQQFVVDGGVTKRMTYPE